MSPVPLLAASFDNLPGLVIVAIIIVNLIVQQLRAAKKAYDKTVVQQRAERDAASAQPPSAQPARTQPVVYLRPDQPVVMPQNAAQARALLLSEIERMAARNAAPASSAPAQPASVQQPAPSPQPSPQQSAATRQQPANRRSTAPQPQRAMYRDPMVIGRSASDAAAAMVDRSFATLPTTLGTAQPSGTLLTTGSASIGRSSTRRMLATAFGDPAHARSSVILAEVLGTPVGLR